MSDNKFNVSEYAAIDFPESGWTLTMQRQNDEIVISLHWSGKIIPTHQVSCGVDDFKSMLERIHV